jgi:tight adherence protein C
MFELLFSVVASLSIFLIVSGAAQLRQVSGMDERLTRSLGGSLFEPVRLHDVTMSRSFAQRVILPMARRTAGVVTWLWPENRLRAVQTRLLLAGSPGQMRAIDYMGLRVLMAAGFCAIGLAYSYLTRATFDLMLVVTLAVFVLSGFSIPNFWLSRRIKLRQQTIQNALPDAIDMLTITTEAGLSFESGLQEIMVRWDNELSREFARTLRDIGMGQSRRYALSAMSARTGVPDVLSFVTALNQAEELGVSIGRVLRTQSEDMRVRRRQRAYEKANQAPVKIMFPLVFLIFPSIFAVLLGPAIPQLMALGG